MMLSELKRLSIGGSSPHYAPAYMSLATVSPVSPVTLPDPSPRHINIQIAAVSMWTDVEQTFVKAHENMCNFVSPVEKVISIFKDRLFVLYKQHQSTNKQKGSIAKEKGIVTKSTNNANTFVRKLLWFLKEEVMVLKSVLFEPKGFSKENRSERVKNTCHCK